MAMIGTRELLLAVLVVLSALYLNNTLSMATARLGTITHKRVTLLIAHPDDEAMFFAPTVMALTRPEARNQVTILCLSSGNAEGLGEIRKKELVQSALVLGLRSEDDVAVVDNPTDFPDSMTTVWPAEKVAALLRETFTVAPGQRHTLDVLITFDSRGVSSHPNHISLYHGAKTFVASLVEKPLSGNGLPVDLYTLTTVGFLRKYAGVLDAVFKVVIDRVTGAGGTRGEAPEVDGLQAPSKGLTFTHGFGRNGWGTAREAMTAAHVSQMKWFRYGWIVLSRYMYINELQLEN